jgi:hypothetical protein
MSIPFQQAFNDSDEVVKLLLIAAGLFIVYNIYESFVNPNGGNPFAPDANDTEGNPNSVGDTSSSAYAGNGILGALGNAVNQALGGIPQSIGTAIGGAAASADGN